VPVVGGGGAVHEAGSATKSNLAMFDVHVLELVTALVVVPLATMYLL
jgi:hypothetical protein